MRCCFQGVLLSFHLMVSVLRCRPRREGIPTCAAVVTLVVKKAETQGVRMVETQAVKKAESQGVRKAETCLYY